MPEESEEVQILKAELRKTKVAKEKLKVVVTRVNQRIKNRHLGLN